MSEQAVLTLERGGHPSVGARLDRLPIVRSHRTITAVVGVGLFFDFFDGTPNAAWLIVTRFLAGLGIGAETALSDCYLAEVVPASRRGRYVAWTYTVGFCAVPEVGFAALWLAPRNILGVAGWRVLFVLGAAGSAVVWALPAGWWRTTASARWPRRCWR